MNFAKQKVYKCQKLLKLVNFRFIELPRRSKFTCTIVKILNIVLASFGRNATRHLQIFVDKVLIFVKLSNFCSTWVRFTVFFKELKVILLTLTGKVTNNLSIKFGWATRREAKSAKRIFASKINFCYIWRKASLRAFSFAPTCLAKVKWTRNWPLYP